MFKPKYILIVVLLTLAVTAVHYLINPSAACILFFSGMVGWYLQGRFINGQ